MRGTWRQLYFVPRSEMTQAPVKSSLSFASPSTLFESPLFVFLSSSWLHPRRGSSHSCALVSSTLKLKGTGKGPALRFSWGRKHHGPGFQRGRRQFPWETKRKHKEFLTRVSNTVFSFCAFFPSRPSLWHLFQGWHRGRERGRGEAESR